MTPPSNHLCSDHSYELPLRRNLLLLLELLELLRFIATVLLDRLGVVPFHDGEVLLPGETWGRGEHADDDAATERLLEAIMWAPTSSPATGARPRTAAAPYRRRRRVAQPADDEQSEEDDDGEGAAVCAICLAALEAGGCETVAELGVCSHAFHAACIDAWAAGSGEAATCPLCRAPMSPTAWDDGQSLCHARLAPVTEVSVSVTFAVMP